MLDQIKGALQRYEELSMRMSQPDAMEDMARWRSELKEHAALEPLVALAKEYEDSETAIAEAESLLTDADAEVQAMAREEILVHKEKIEKIEQELRMMLLPKDPNDDKNVILEVRAGTGGEEAALFGTALVRMYTRYAENMGWQVETLSVNETEIGGMKEAVLMIMGNGAFSRLKYESGVHRVQRVPETESSGRIHTSAATVAVLPEVEDVEIDVSPQDLRIDTYRSGGAGGQHVNKTESAIRITHIPTGLVVTCQDEKSQIKNKEKAMKVLKSRLLDFYQQQQDSTQRDSRRLMVGSGDRSERIRTYNFPQGRVTDHRINLTLYRLPAFLEGDCDELFDALHMAEQAAKLKNGTA